MSDSTPLKVFRCINLDLPDDEFDDPKQCESRALFIVEGEAGWSGKYCRRHALSVVSTMLSQVEASGYAIRIRKFNP